MKKVPFDLEKSKAGAKLVTRDGRSVRIVCWDVADEHFKVIALIDNGCGEEPHTYTTEGRRFLEIENNLDLFILEESTISPYANAKEVLEDMKQHGPMVRFNENGYYYSILKLSQDTVMIHNSYHRFDKLKEKCTWQDGHPFGVEEGGE